MLRRDSILIGVGSTEAQMLAVKVLAYSLHKHSQRPLNIVPLYQSGLQVALPKDPKNHPRTPFSYQRFLIPELAGHRGRGIYLDSDMLLFADIGELYDTPMNGADVLATQPLPNRKISYAVLLINCATAWKIEDIIRKLDNDELSYEQLMFEFKVPGNVEVKLGAHWNSVDYYKEGETALLHYTAMQHQPWLTRDTKLGVPWIQTLLDAIAAGEIETSYVAECVNKRWVRPSLLHQVEQGYADPKKVPFLVGLKDRPFTSYCKKLKWAIY